ncbi:glycosyltransferase family 4 protein [Rhodobacteraceae bacterium NNCM2]|nr:glycosyltransferase family 4 protein [Coraliihabitans acroporae]
MGTEPKLLLDVTRSLRRLRHAHASGIDRVERAYIEWSLGRQARYLAIQPDGSYLLDRAGAERLLALMDGGSYPLDLRARLRPDRNHRLRMGEALVRDQAIAAGPLPSLAEGAEVYLNTAHMNLDHGVMDGVFACQRVVMIHDLIPLEYPQYARADGPAQMLGRLRAACSADHIIANSRDTAARIARAACAHQLNPPPVTTIPLAIDAPGTDGAQPQAGTHFVCIGTIEPRKNHALLLDIWQPDWPDLYIIGRRGWENREVFERLDRAPANIREENDLDDAAVRGLLASARALLFPSHVEGFGLPLAEALSVGTPVIASDIAALREVGGEVPDYLDPDEPAAWVDLVEDYIAGKGARAAQMHRMTGWERPKWEDHFAEVDSLLKDLVLNKAR